MSEFPLALVSKKEKGGTRDGFRGIDYLVVLEHRLA